MAKNSFSSDGGCFVKNLPCIIPKLLQRSPQDRLLQKVGEKQGKAKPLRCTISISSSRLAKGRMSLFEWCSLTCNLMFTLRWNFKRHILSLLVLLTSNHNCRQKQISKKPCCRSNQIPNLQMSCRELPSSCSQPFCPRRSKRNWRKSFQGWVRHRWSKCGHCSET